MSRRGGRASEGRFSVIARETATPHPTRQENQEPVQHLRKKLQEPVEICSLTGCIPHPEMAGRTPLGQALSRHPSMAASTVRFQAVLLAPGGCFSGLPDALAFGQVVLPG